MGYTPSVSWEEFETEIKFQGTCGSCYAFTASGCQTQEKAFINTLLEVLETYLAKHGKLQENLSPQQLVDCGSKHYSPFLNGCDSGDPGSALAYLKSYGLAK